MGVLWMLPETSTGWDKEKIQNTGAINNYFKNIKNGPVWDHDKPIYNYVGHPLAGAAYYTMARHRGLDRMQSFGYSFMMSTFFWEFGFEAFAEKPSIQDLIVTPVIGSTLGEMLYQIEHKIDENDGQILGSKTLGKIVKVILNPMGSVSIGINRVLGKKFIQESQSEIVLRSDADSFHSDNGIHIGNYIGFRVRFLF